MSYVPTSQSIAQILANSDGAYSNRTARGYTTDLRIFASWCDRRGVSWLPTAPEVVAAFVDDQVEHYRISTIKRRVCAIAFAHRMQDLPTPTGANVVRLALRRASRERGCRAQQKRGLTYDLRNRIVNACPQTLAGLRDAAIISVGYDTLCRSSELAAMQVDHLNLALFPVSILETL